MKKHHFNTKVIHAGQTPCAQTGAIMTPIYATSTYVQKSPGVHQGYEYSRTHNPTRKAYEDCVCELEEGLHAYAFASGMAAIAAILETLEASSHIIASDDLYGGTHRIFTEVKNKSSNLSLDLVDMTNIDDIKKHIKPQTKMLWLETPSNPMLKIIDIKTISELAKHHNLLLVVDNTFASPYLQKPLTLGADISIHSTTKYLNGHSDLIGGIVATNNKEMAEKISFIQNATGAIPSPFDSFLILRSIKTLAVRMERHCDNTEELAKLLKQHPLVRKIYYPGLNCHPSYEIAKKQMKRFGGMISFELKGDLNTAKAFLQHCQLFSLAESLGGVESLIEHPALMTHASIPIKKRQLLGISDTLIRLSVGIEDINDLIDDLQYALNQARSK